MILARNSCQLDIQSRKSGEVFSLFANCEVCQAGHPGAAFQSVFLFFTPTGLLEAGRAHGIQSNDEQYEEECTFQYE